MLHAGYGAVLPARHWSGGRFPLANKAAAVVAKKMDQKRLSWYCGLLWFGSVVCTCFHAWYVRDAVHLCCYRHAATRLRAVHTPTGCPYCLKRPKRERGAPGTVMQWRLECNRAYVWAHVQLWMINLHYSPLGLLPVDCEGSPFCVGVIVLVAWSCAGQTWLCTCESV